MYALRREFSREFVNKIVWQKGFRLIISKHFLGLLLFFFKNGEII